MTRRPLLAIGAMNPRTIFSPKCPVLRTYGSRTRISNRPRGILLQKTQSQIGNSKAHENTNTFSLSDDSDDIQTVKDNKRKTSRTTQSRKGTGTPIQKQSRKTRGKRVARWPLKTSSEQNEKQREESQPNPQMESTPRHGLDQANQCWVKTKVKGSDSEDDSIELPRRDQELTWQEKISLLMPKMIHKTPHQTDQKVSGVTSGCEMAGHSVLNLSAEEVMEDDDESSDDHCLSSPGTSKEQKNSNILASRMPPHHSPFLDKLPEMEPIEEKQENKNKNSKLPTYDVTCDEFTYTYEWVTDTADSRPVSHQTSSMRGKGPTAQTTLQSTDRMSSIKTVNRKSQTNSDMYTYDWVTDSDMVQNRPVSGHSCRDGQAISNDCPSSTAQGTKPDTSAKGLDRRSGLSKPKHTDRNKWSHGFFNSTKKLGALSVFQAKFPEDLSVITSSPSQEKVVSQDKDSFVPAESHKRVLQMNSTRKKDGLDIDLIKLPDMSVIERIGPVEGQCSLVDQPKAIMKDDKVPYCLSSTRRRGGLDFDEDKFMPDISEIKEVHSVDDRQGHLQQVQEITPKARTRKSEVATPVKSAIVATKKKRRLLPKSSTVLFMSGCNGSLVSHTPSLSSIRSSQNTECNLSYQEVTKDNPCKETKKSNEEKHFFRSGPNSLWKEDSEKSKKILTSTPVSSTHTQFKRPEVNLTCVPCLSFEDELVINESIEVNSDEIVPEDLVEEDIDVEEELSGKHRGLERNLQKTPTGNRKQKSTSSSTDTSVHIQSSSESTLKAFDSDFLRKISVKSVKKSFELSQATECCLTDPTIVFPHRKYISYRKTSQDTFKDRTRPSEDILLTHKFKRR